MKLYILSGTSGAGKSIALNSLEDQGIYCIDNLPVSLLPAFARELLQSSLHQQAAVGIDVRSLNFESADVARLIKNLQEQEGIEVEIIFLDADDHILIKRFSETRRRHPLADQDRSLAEAIQHERKLLFPLSSTADVIFDSSHTNVHELRDIVQMRLGSGGGRNMSVLLESFGYKHGIPLEADYVFDVRCLPNPHWEPDLRVKNGTDTEVAQFLQKEPEVQRMLEDIHGFISNWLERFAHDKRNYMTIAIGCTGGQHRSVYCVEQLATLLNNWKVLVRHREL